MIKKSVIIFIILLFNGLTNTTPENLLLAIPQIGVILYFLFTGKIEKAVIWHFIFLITSYSYFGDFQGFVDDMQLTSYNYAKLKFVGPLSYSYLFSIVLFIVASVKYKYKPSHDKKNLFYSFYKLIVFYSIFGFGFGIIGLAFGNYYLEGFINYGTYMFIILIHTSIFLKIPSDYLKKELLSFVIPLLALAPIVDFLIRQLYPGMIDTSPISLFSVLLLPALLFQKRFALLNIIGLLFTFYNYIFFRTSGKSIIFLIIIVALTFIYSFSKTAKKEHPIRSRLLRNSLFLLILGLPTIVLFITENHEGNSNILFKIHQVESLFNFIVSSTDVNNIAESPYVRVTSLINILYEGLNNPIVLLLGKGYGGYFQDHFNYFSHLDLYNGAFSDKAIMTGHFYTGHDTMVTVPMFNGLIGLFLLIRFVLLCIKFSKNNFLILSVILFLLLLFYFDTLIGTTGVFFLYLGSININKLEIYNDNVSGKRQFYN